MSDAVNTAAEVLAPELCKDTEIALLSDHKRFDEIFLSRDKLELALQAIEKQATSIVADPSTAKGRAEYKSAAYKVRQTKTFIDNIAKNRVAELKAMPKLIDANRHFVREYLDALAETIRAPYTAWEQEQERKKLAKQVEDDHAEALEIDVKWTQEREAALAEQRRKEAERMAALKAEAERAAQEAAQEEVKRIKLESERREAKAVFELQQAELARKAAEKRAAQAEQQAQQVQAAPEPVRPATAVPVADPGVEHKKEINRAARADLMAFAGLTEEQATLVVIALAKGKIRGVAMNY